MLQSKQQERSSAPIKIKPHLSVSSDLSRSSRVSNRGTTRMFHGMPNSFCSRSPTQSRQPNAAHGVPCTRHTHKQIVSTVCTYNIYNGCNGNSYSAYANHKTKQKKAKITRNNHQKLTNTTKSQQMPQKNF